MSEDRILFVINQKSGSSENADIESDIKGLMVLWNILHFDLLFLSGNDFVKLLKNKIASFSPSIVVAAGGDGTVNMVASVIKGQNLKLGIIPLGSANGLAAELNIPDVLEDAVNLIIRGNAKPIDVIRVNDDHISLHLSDVGINARIIKEFEREGKRGLVAYLKHFLKEIVKPQPIFHCTILSGGQLYTHKAYMIGIANCKRYKTGAVINPTGKWDDGVFELVVIRPHKRWILKSFIGAFMGTFHLQQHVDVYTCSSAIITVMPAQELQVDGETIGKKSEVRAQIEPHAIQVIYGS